MQADNESMAEMDRDELIHAAYEHFMKFQHHDYALRMLTAINSENLGHVYNGLQSVPKPFDSGFEVKVSQTNGALHSPFYGEPFDIGHYKSDKYHQVALEFPDDLAEQLGNGKLVVELEVDTREEDSWREEVRYIEGPKYKVYNAESDQELSWHSAEAHCQSQGGHLASVLNSAELEELLAVSVDSYTAV